MKKNAVFNIWNDLEIRVTLGAWFAVTAAVFLGRGFLSVRHLDGRQLHLAPVLDGFSLLAVGVFSLSVAFFYAIRLRPVSRLAGIAPAATAVLGACFILGFLALKPRPDLPAIVQIQASGMILAGYAFALFALAYLGRSFSILPEGRKLVTTGPYRFVRHPMYVAEAVVILGIGIHFASFAAAALIAAQLLFQLGRMHYEEKVLRATFPEYEDYSRRTARLIPGVY